MDWWDRILFSVRRACNHLAFRIGIRKNGGLLKLRRDVRACDYEDVHVMWDMLKKTEELGQTPKRGKNGCLFRVYRWARNAPFLCRNF